jgi:uracil-DNA glycosylase
MSRASNPSSPNAPASDAFADLLAQVRDCRLCAGALPHAPRPVVVAHAQARVLIVGQAPGRKVHETGIPWNDASGDRLRQWLRMDRDSFYNDPRLAIMPMGFCYPGRGRSGDLPPRPECAPYWHGPLLFAMPEIRLTLLFGRHAQLAYLPERAALSSGEIVMAGPQVLPDGGVRFPLPHPSPRNIAWFKRNAWFEAETLPALRAALNEVLAATITVSTARLPQDSAT